MVLSTSSLGSYKHIVLSTQIAHTDIITQNVNMNTMNKRKMDY